MLIHNADKILFRKIYFAANNHKESALAQEEIQSLKPNQESPQDSTKISIKNKLTNPPFARADFYAAEIFARNDIMLSQGFVIL